MAEYFLQVDKTKEMIAINPMRRVANYFGVV